MSKKRYNNEQNNAQEEVINEEVVEETSSEEMVAEETPEDSTISDASYYDESVDSEQDIIVDENSTELDEIDKEIEQMEAEYMATRNPVTKASLVDKIRRFKKKRKELLEGTSEVKAVSVTPTKSTTTKEPVSHRGLVVNTSTFIMNK